MERILIIQLSRMGDLVQTLPLLQCLKHDHPQREVTLVCSREFQAIVESQPLHDRLVALDWSEVQKLSDEANRQKFTHWPAFDEIPEFSEAYDLVVNLTHDEGSAALCEKVNGRQKSGRIHTLPNEIRLLGDWAKYFFAAVKHRKLNLFNLVDIYQGMGGVTHRPAKHYLEVDQAAERDALALLREHGYASQGKLVGLQMGASELHRAWPVEKFAALAQRLGTEPKVEIVLFGNQKESALGEEFARLTDCAAINLIGKTELRQLPALLKSCDLFISNDTGPIHIAAAVGTRVVGLYFSTAYFAETAPYGEGHVVLQVESETLSTKPSKNSADSTGIDFLSVEAVLAVGRRMLGRADDWPPGYPGLTIYQSTFLANGTLIYVPVGKATAYLTAALSRLMWEKALGVSTDKTFVRELLSRICTGQELEEHMADVRQALLRMRTKFAEGTGLARQLAAAAASDDQTGVPLAALDEQITQTVKEISSLGERFGLLTDFFHFEIMDLDFLPKPALGDELGRKFKKLESLSECFLETLERIEVLGQSG